MAERGYWLFKSEPTAYSFSDLMAEEGQTAEWDGVRNYQARNFLRDEYMAVARDSVGLSQMKGGAELYRHMVEGTTTLPLEPDYLHELGLSEVARIKNGLEQIKQEVGFEGPIRPDHVPQLVGEGDGEPGYTMLGRLFAYGYMRGLMQAANQDRS